MKTRKVYLAAPWASRQAMPAIAAQFERAGHRITRYWWLITTTEDDLGDHERRELVTWARQDIQAILDADWFILINQQLRGAESSGKAVETGIALAHHKPIALVGQHTNIFHYLPNVVVLDTVDDVIVRIAGSG